jgi:hypothetical protein
MMVIGYGGDGVNVLSERVSSLVEAMTKDADV